MYQQAPSGIIRLADGACIPLDANNSDYRAYLAWVDSGNVPEQLPAPDWRPAAIERLTALRDRLLDVVSGMQSDYLTQYLEAPTPEGLAVLTTMVSVKDGLKDIKTAPAIASAASEVGFNAAVVARWNEICAPAPLDVKTEFNRYIAQII